MEFDTEDQVLYPIQCKLSKTFILVGGEKPLKVEGKHTTWKLAAWWEEYTHETAVPARPRKPTFKKKATERLDHTTSHRNSCSLHHCRVPSGLYFLHVSWSSVCILTPGFPWASLCSSWQTVLPGVLWSYGRADGHVDGHQLLHQLYPLLPHVITV